MERVHAAVIVLMRLVDASIHTRIPVSSIEIELNCKFRLIECKFRQNSERGSEFSEALYNCSSTNFH